MCQTVLETAEPDQVRAICECIYNIMHGNIPIPEGIKEELARRKQILGDLEDTKVPYKIKKEILLYKVEIRFQKLLFRLPLVSFLGLSVIQRNNGHIQWF